MAPTFAVVFAAGEARLAIALLILGIALLVLGIRFFARFIAWITPDGNPLRRAAVAGLLLLPLPLLALPVFPPVVDAVTDRLDSPAARQAGLPPKPPEPVRPAPLTRTAPKPSLGETPGQQLTIGLPTDIHSVGGRHRYRNVRATLHLSGPDSRVVTLDVRTSDSDWGTTISVPKYGSSTSRLAPTAVVVLPKDESLSGREATVSVSATLVYPGLVSRFDLTYPTRPGGGFNDSFTTQSVSLSGSRRIRFLSRAEQDRFTKEKAEYEQETARHREATTTYEKERQRWNASHWERSRLEGDFRYEKRSQAASMLRLGWLGIPLCLLAVPAVCLVGRRKPTSNDDCRQSTWNEDY